MKCLLVGAAILGLVATNQTASASTINLGTLISDQAYGLVGQASGAPNSVSVIDTYQFGVAGESSFAASVVDLIFNQFNFKTLYGELFDEDPTTCLGCVALASASGMDSFHLSYADLAGGAEYFLRISGEFGSGGHGAYGGALSVSPVPIPGAIWLLGSALAGLGALQRRRNKSPSAALTV
jgi:hypothetical protein